MKKTRKYGFLILISLLIVGRFQATAQKSTVVYAERDTQQLKMDIYEPAASFRNNACIIFAFGGGFLTGSRDAKAYTDYFKSLTDSGYIVASIDYRLGLKNSTKPPGIFNKKPLIQSIEMAVEDFYSATDYLIKHAAKYQIDTGKIIASGSSAGAITALTADYRKRNQVDKKILSDQFQYVGIISFAGAVYSNHGRPRYALKAAPMLLMHGDRDKIVPFKKKSFFGTGIFGPSVIIRDFKKNNSPYWFMVFENTGHAASSFPMKENLEQIHIFLREYILKSRPLYIESKILNKEKVFKEIDFKKAFENRNG